MKIICILGKAQHGKDTAASFFESELKNNGYKTLITHYADLLKYICKNFFDWNGEKDEEGRHLLQHIGTDVIRAQRPDYWVDFIIDILNIFEQTWDYVIIPDCRFPNEINKLKNAGFNTYTVRVNRLGFNSPLSQSQLSHISENALDNFCPDYTVDNGDIEDFRNKINDLSRHLMAV